MRRACCALVSTILVLGVLAAPAAHAQPLPPMVTDRPDFTESSEVVVKGGLQFETGLSLEGEGAGVDRMHTLTVPSSLMRIGIGLRTELRIGADGVLSERLAGAQRSGFSDLEVGAKVRLVDEGSAGVDMAVIPAVSLPIGSAGWSSDTFDPSVKLTWARTLGAGFGLAGNLNVAVLSDAAGRFDQQAISVSLDRDLVAGFGGYFEVFGFSRRERHGSRAITVNGGVSRGIGDRVQVDVEGGRGVTRGAPQWFVGFGLALRNIVRE